MLRVLRVGNLALVDELEIHPGPGLTMVTGETGAGKSLIAGALSLLAGGKAEKGLVRHGTELAFVEGVFDLGGRPDDQEALRHWAFGSVLTAFWSCAVSFALKGGAGH